MSQSERQEVKRKSVVERRSFARSNTPNSNDSRSAPASGKSADSPPQTNSFDMYGVEIRGESVHTPEAEDTMLEPTPPPPTRHGRLTTAQKFATFGTYTKEDLAEMSAVSQLRGYYSDTCLPRTLQQRLPGLRPGTLLKERCLSMEDLILASDGYNDLVTGDLDEVGFRQYDISLKMMNDWKSLFEFEKDRFSFFNELFALGYVVDSLEVPIRPDNLGYLVEADPSAYRAKVDYGRVVYKTKHVYLGNFRNWAFEGPGRYTWQNGTTYQGDFKDGVMDGEGMLLWKDGSVYEGQFAQGIRVGWGVYSTAEGYTYAGDWFQGLPHGKGKMWYDPENDNGDYYDGDWAEGKPNGFGTRDYAKGDRYVGNWESGVRNGFGTMTWREERQVYKGDWGNGVPHGKGRHTWYLPRTQNSNFPTRHVYQGNWEFGLRHGIGRMIYPCGSIYEGRWQHGSRHGKGVFINPAGDMLVGLFRFGSILGGMDVPLHTPTYECDFGGIVVVLNRKYGFISGQNSELTEQTNISDVTIRYLSQIRKLYKRAGELGESWGNQGMYPQWMKKPKTTGKKLQDKGRGFRRHGDKEEAHAAKLFKLNEGKALKGSPDNVYPLTRFGLWLIMRDCPGILRDVSVADFDRMWNSIPSISFQTNHNPFEPVYLWQFLQCLVAIAAVIYMEVPRRNEMLRSRKDKAIPKIASANDLLEKNESALDTAAKKVTLNADSANKDKVSSSKKQSTVDTSTMKVVEKEDYSKKQSVFQVEAAKKQSVYEAPGKKGQPNDDFTKKQSVFDAPGKKGQANDDFTKKQSVFDAPNKKDQLNEDSTKKQSVFDASSKKGPLHQESVKKVSGSTKEFPRTISATLADIVLNEEEEGEEEQEPIRRAPKLWSDIELPAADEMYGWDISKGKCKENIMRRSIGIEDQEQVQAAVRELMAENNTSRFPSAQNSALQVLAETNGPRLSHAFERLLLEIMLPCLMSDPGANLPPIPDPLPSLTDLYNSYCNSHDGKEIITGTDFLQSILPHPIKQEAIYWTRSKEILSPTVDLNIISEFYWEIYRTRVMTTVEDSLGPDFLGDNCSNMSVFTDKLKKEFYRGFDGNSIGKNKRTSVIIYGLGNKVFGIDPLTGTKAPEGELGIGTDSSPASDEPDGDLMDATLFSERDLASEPFLWTEESKCISVPKRERAFANLTSKDVMNVLQHLSPRVCGETKEADMGFDMTFCDWLFATSMVAKISADRDVHHAMKKQSTVEHRPLTRRLHSGRTNRSQSVQKSAHEINSGSGEEQVQEIQQPNESPDVSASPKSEVPAEGSGSPDAGSGGPADISP